MNVQAKWYHVQYDFLFSLNFFIILFCLLTIITLVQAPKVMKLHKNIIPLTIKHYFKFHNKSHFLFLFVELYIHTIEISHCEVITRCAFPAHYCMCKTPLLKNWRFSGLSMCRSFFILFLANFTQNLPYVLPTKFRFIWLFGFRG
jgi:hypothetical protein